MLFFMVVTVKNNKHAIRLIQILIDHGMHIPFMPEAADILIIALSLIGLKEQKNCKFSNESNGKEGHHDLLELLHMDLIANPEHLIDEFCRGGIQDGKILLWITDGATIQNNGMD